VLHDGAYLAAVQDYYTQCGRGQLALQPLHHLLEQAVQHAEKGYNSYRIIFAGWYASSNDGDTSLLPPQHELLLAGITARWVLRDPAAPTDQRGVAVTLASDALELALSGRVDVVVLVAAGAYLAELARTLTRHGVRVLLAHATPREQLTTTLLDRRLRDACSYVVNVAQFEHAAERHWQALFQGLFRPPPKMQEQAE